MMIDLTKDRNIEPVDENLNIILGKSFPAYKTLVEKLSDFEVSLEWRFYRDGGWLAKITQKKKTIFWGKAEANHFAIAFNFNERNREGVFELNISDELKQIFSSALPTSRKVTTIRIDIYSENELPDVYQLIEYKKRAK